MNWEAVGAIAELGGALAVGITLVFLVVQLRQNTRALEENSLQAKRATLDGNFQDLARWRDLLIRDEALTEIWRRGCDGEELSAIEAERFVQIANELIFGLWRGYEGGKAVSDDAYVQELLDVSAVFSQHRTLRNRIQMLATSKIFEDFATEVAARVSRTDPAESDSATIYARMRDPDGPSD